MTWLRAIFARIAPAPAISTTAFGRTIEQMAAADDAAERARLGKLLSVQLEGYLSGQAGNTYVALLELEERIRAGQGETNEMIGEAVSLIRGQEAAVAGLRATFQERMSAVESRLDRHARKLAEHDESRDASIAERRLLMAQYQESKQDRAAIHGEIRELRDLVEEALATREAQGGGGDGNV
jgi:hypothetical protein